MSAESSVSTGSVENTVESKVDLAAHKIDEKSSGDAVVNVVGTSGGEAIKAGAIKGTSCNGDAPNGGASNGRPSNGSEDPSKSASNGHACKLTSSNGDASGSSSANADPSTSTTGQAEPIAGTSSKAVSPSKKDMQIVSQAMQYLAAGKRDLLIQDPNSAVASLAQSCQLLGEHYGEMASECGEAYYFYGRALLDLARMESGVIDNVLDGVPSEDESVAESSQVEDPEKCTDEEKTKVAEDVDEALKENYEELEKLEAEKRKEKQKQVEVGGGEVELAVGSVQEKGGGKDESENSADDDEENEGEEEEGANGDEASNGDKETDSGKAEKDGEADEGREEKKEESIASDDNATTEAKDTGDAEAVQKEEEEDPSNLQLAWEMLELSKTVLMKQAGSLNPTTDKEKELKFNVESRISDVFQTLGELSIENENYPQAIDDLKTCLKRRQDLMPDDSRLIAETYYQLGVAQGFNIEFDAGVESLNSAIAVLQKRIDNLKEKKESVDPAKKNDAFYTREGEIKEIEGLIPEIREKIADTNDMKKETFKKLGDRRLLAEEVTCKSTQEADDTGTNSTSSSVKVSSISSSLIKKRKKSGDAGEGEAKKQHVEEQSSTSNDGKSNSKNGN